LILGRNFFSSNLILIGVAESNDNYITSFKPGNCFKRSRRSFTGLGSCRIFRTRSCSVNRAGVVENPDFGRIFFSSNLILIGVAESHDNYVTSFKGRNSLKHTRRGFPGLGASRMF